MTKCYVCDSLTKYKLCNRCKYDNDLFISKSKVITNFRLKYDDIDKSNLFYISFKMYGTECKKYLIKDVLVLAEKLSRDLPNNNEQKIAYEKYKIFYDSQNEITSTRLIIMNLISTMMTKIDNPINYDYTNDRLVMRLIDDAINNNYLTHIDIVMYFVDLIQKNIIRQIEMQNRKKHIDKIIDDYIDPAYIKEAKKSGYYMSYIDRGNNINDMMEHIEKIITERARKDERMYYLNEYIENNNLMNREQDIYNDNIVKTYLEYGVLYNFVDGSNNPSSQKNLKTLTEIAIKKSDLKKYVLWICKYPHSRREFVLGSIESNINNIDKLLEMSPIDYCDMINKQNTHSSECLCGKTRSPQCIDLKCLTCCNNPLCKRHTKYKKIYV